MSYTVRVLFSLLLPLIISDLDTCEVVVRVECQCRDYTVAHHSRTV